MATSTSWAQDVITCELCDKAAQQFCNSCQVSLCSNCVSKHMDAFKSMSHEIAPFLNRKTTLVLPACQEHSGQRCEVNCKECNTPLCLKCIVSEKNLNALQEYHNKIRDLISEMNTIVKQNEQLFTSNKMSDVNEYQSKLNEYQDFPEHVDLEFPSLRSNINQGKEFIIEIGGYRATLKQMSPPSPSADVSRLTTGKLMDQVRVIATIPTNYKPLRGVPCVGGAEAWIFGKKQTITRIDIHGAVRDTVTTTCQYGPNDISVTRERELIYSDRNSETVNMVRQGRSETLITPLQDWTPSRLSCTRSGDILVHAYTLRDIQFKNKIIRYQGQNIKQEISKDGQGNPIFNDGGNSLYMSENNNGDICISDAMANTVVVVDKTGRVRFRYDGTPARREKSFYPRDIVTDALSQIIVTDSKNNCLHILDQNGQFLRCVNDRGLERLEKPSELSIDSEGRLWVGCNRGEIKVIKYLEQS
ncbi:uncharacterized protein LOC144624505 [Crassostrea virginica]